MRQVRPYWMWVGNAGDLRDLRSVLGVGIRAVVDLALNEPPAALNREMVYLRFPLLDGEGSPFWLLRSAVEATATLLRLKVPTLVCCSNGVSRSPSVVAAALSLHTGKTAEDCLALLSEAGQCDVSPGLWHEVRATLDAMAAPGGAVWP